MKPTDIKDILAELTDDPRPSRAEFIERFKIWLKTPETISMPGDIEDRIYYLQLSCVRGCDIFGDSEHICKDLPDNMFIWNRGVLSEESNEFWILTNRNNHNDTGLIKECPYCGAKLAEGQGDFIMIKRSDDYWSKSNYTYYEFGLDKIDTRKKQQ